MEQDNTNWMTDKVSDDIKVYHKWYHEATALASISHKHLSIEQNKDTADELETAFGTFVKAAAHKLPEGIIQAGDMMRQVVTNLTHYIEGAAIEEDVRRGIYLNADKVRGDVTLLDVWQEIMDHIDPEWRKRAGLLT